METKNKILEKFIEIQTKKEEIELLGIEERRKIRLDKQKVIFESYDNLFNLDKNLILDKVKEHSEEDISYSLPEEVSLWLSKKYNINFELLNGFFRDLDREIFDKDLKEKQLMFKIFMKNLKEELKGRRKDKKQDDLIWKIDKLYSISKKDGLSKINTNALDRICMENGIKIFKKDRSLIAESVTNRLLSDVVKELRIKNTSRTPILKEVREKIFEGDSFKCRVCSSKDYLEIGHKIPVSKGGSNNPNNLITLCRGCNSKIGTSVIIENEKTIKSLKRNI